MEYQFKSLEKKKYQKKKARRELKMGNSQGILAAAVGTVITLKAADIILKKTKKLGSKHDMFYTKTGKAKKVF